MYGQNHPERIKLNNQIRDWNTNRLDLFEISEPNEYLEFYGVMRFFYQGDDLKYQTKCLRVSSTATTLDLIEAVVIKFHPDLKMLSNDRYALYESHNMQDRKMKDNEHPLIVQLNWANDDKDGKFILKNETRRRRSTDLTSHAMLNNYSMSKSTSALGSVYDSQTLRSQSSAVYSSSASNFFTKRMLSSKKSKRRGKGGRDSIQDSEEALRLAAELSGKPPESSFTRTISNPDEVMKRRRQRKLESRLEQFSGANETGGTLKIYGDSINPDIPYKTLLLSVNDTAEKVLSETLDKYGLAQEDHRFYVLVQQNIPSKDDRNRQEMPQEIILHDQDCPLGILVHRPPKRGNATFAVRRRTPMDKFPSKPRMPPFSVSRDSMAKSPGPQRNKTREAQPSSQSLIPSTPTKIPTECPRLIKLMIDNEGNLYEEDDIFSLTSLINNDSKVASPNEGSRFIKIGSQPSAVGNYPNILLPQESFPDIRPTHCHISSKIDSQTGEIRLTLTPTLDSISRIPKPCLVYINQQKIEKSTKLEHDDIIQVGESVLFKFENIENHYLNLAQESSNFTSNHIGEGDSNESFQMHYYTADLPVTIKYSYNQCQQLIDRIMNLSRIYAEKGTKDLFSCNVHLKYNNLDELFRLAPAYMFYLVLRSGLGKDNHFSNLINIIAHQIEQVIQEDKNSVEKEVFWLSNTSELLHLLQCDNDLRYYSGPAQEVLATAIEQAFSILQTQFSQDLMILLPAFIDEDESDLNDDTKEDISPCLDRASVLITYGDIDYPIQHLLQTLSLAYNLFHNCQVNVALTIQMFSQLFHLLNTWLFNAVLGDRSSFGDDAVEPIPVCPEWGQRLNRRLTRIRNWSETNGLDMAANCHLQKMYQVVELMEANKSDLNLFGEKCLELINVNGAQLHALLENCVDSAIPNAWIEVVVNTAIQLHDQTFNDGVPQNKNNLPLYEDLDLRLPLLLPADGYCCDRGIVSCPKDLRNMLNSLTGVLSYKLNPPTIDEVDTRWKSYLGPYENTPSVSRSGTIVEQSPSSAIKTNTQLGFPRNIITDERSSMALSSPESEGDSDSYRKNNQSRYPNRTKQIPMESSLENHKPLSRDFSDGSSDEEQVYKGDLKNRYVIKLKKINNSLGLSIIAARKSPNDIFRIYVKDVISGGAAHKFGKIEIGDQLVSVDGQLLEDINQDEAVEFMKKTKPMVKLLMEKDAARRHGVFDVILKSKSAKPAPSQLNHKPVQKPLILSIEPAKVSKQKPIVLQNKIPVSKSIDNTESTRHASREHLPLKKPQPLEKEHRKRPDYKIPPLPQHGKAPPRPARALPENRYKPKVEDISDPDYHSLPVRKHRSSQQPLPRIPKYTTTNKGRSTRDTEDLSYSSLQNVKNNPKRFSSQPNLATSIPRKRLDSPVSASDTESSGTISTSDEEESVENKPPVPKSSTHNRQNASLYAKIPMKQKPNLASKTSPVKALSDNNIRLASKGMPRHEIATSDDPINHRSSKNQFLTRPVIVTNSDPITKNNSESSMDTANLRTPVRISNKNHRSHSASSESESETLSSVSQSLSSDPSPRPQGKINSEPIIPARQTENIYDVKHKSNINTSHDSLKQNYWTPDEPAKYAPIKKIEEIQPIQSKPVNNVTRPVNLSHEKSLKQNLPNSTFSNIQMYPAPFPTALHPQYHPPNVLEENNWNTESRDSTIKTPTDEEIRMRRKTIEEKIRYETDMGDKKFDYVPHLSADYKDLNISQSNDTKPNRNSTRYGRPQFSDNKTRPQSEFNIPIDNGKINYSDPLPAPSVMQKGIIVPASPIDRSQANSTNEIYQDHMQKYQSNNSGGNRQPESTEQLSFRDKIKLFAQKNGETDVIQRNRFSSKQRRIESGDFS